MKTFFMSLLKHTSDMVSRIIVYGGTAYVAWYFFDEEVKQGANLIVDILDRIF